MVTGKDIGRQIGTCQVTDVQVTIGVWPGYTDKHMRHHQPPQSNQDEIRINQNEKAPTRGRRCC
jgi:hypothetical protein